MFYQDFLKLFAQKKEKGNKGDMWREEVFYVTTPDQNGELILHEPANASGLTHVILQNVPIGAIALHMDFAQNSNFGHPPTGVLSAILQSHRCDYCILYENLGQKYVLFIELKNTEVSKTEIARKVWGSKTTIEYLFCCHNDLCHTRIDFIDCNQHFWQFFINVKKSRLGAKRAEFNANEPSCILSIASQVQAQQVHRSNDDRFVVDIQDLLKNSKI
jgi:hypothetical protein